ncbi:S26 family signal peptidase [Bradyrhizobium sp. SYSU BS000235]|uniref:S26 family signal peptidase n=1 Tax=Bradyrhizobium sp. SYSU BS000235 TaxID=3411332 RepID=UPI003C71A26A
MGDNRDNSTDCRVRPDFGTISLKSVFGRAGMIFLSRARAPNGDSSLLLERIGKIVR